MLTIARERWRQVATTLRSNGMSNPPKMTKIYLPGETVTPWLDVLCVFAECYRAQSTLDTQTGQLLPPNQFSCCHQISSVQIDLKELCG